MLKLIAAVVVLAVVIILVLAATKPATFHVERSATIAAPPEKIAAFVTDFHHWDAWSPWAKLDPAMQVTYSGPDSGTGAIYHWKGNSKVGEGEMEILAATPEKTNIRLDFIKPFEGKNTATFYYSGSPAGPTTVRWTMDGPSSFITKLMMVFTSMDKMVGPDFDRGLTNLKSAAEHP